MLLAGTQLRAARAMLRLDQERLAAEAGVALTTVQRLERQDGRLRANTATIDAIQRVLEKAGIVFINGDAPGVRLRIPEPA